MRAFYLRTAALRCDPDRVLNVIKHFPSSISHVWWQRRYLDMTTRVVEVVLLARDRAEVLVGSYDAYYG